VNNQQPQFASGHNNVAVRRLFCLTVPHTEVAVSEGAALQCCIGVSIQVSTYGIPRVSRELVIHQCKLDLERGDQVKDVC
jgi:hypothetical protein